MDSMLGLMPPAVVLKGLVHNNEEIYAEVASYSHVPRYHMHKFWNVYTTLSKHLDSPTASRLEHFWWHVWGSNPYGLKGEILAKHFYDIVHVKPFVPLGGDEDEAHLPSVLPPPAALPSFMKKGREQSVTAKAGKDIPVRSHRQMLPTDNALRSLSSSASKPPPTHPILKKTSGPSASGSRPTARFLSPQGSIEDDSGFEDVGSYRESQSSATNAKQTMQSSAKKKPASAGKRFVASTTAKRRPMLPRRGSSKDSTITISETPSSNGSRNSGTISPIAESNAASFASDSTSASQGRPKLSAKAAGKRPAVLRRHTSERRVAQLNGSAPPRGKTHTRNISSQAQRHDYSPQSPTLLQHSTDPSAELQLAELAELAEVSPLSAPQTSATTAPAPSASSASLTQQPSRPTPAQRSSLPPMDSPVSSMPPPAIPLRDARPSMAMAMGRSQSHTGYERYRQNSATSFGPDPSLFTSATASMTNVAAQGTIIDQSGMASLPKTSPISNFYDLDLPYTQNSRSSLSSSVLEPRLTPTQPSSTTSLPLARTKSQLILLLEREKEKLGDRPSGRR